MSPHTEARPLVATHRGRLSTAQRSWQHKLQRSWQHKLCIVGQTTNGPVLALLCLWQGPLLLLQFLPQGLAVSPARLVNPLLGLLTRHQAEESLLHVLCLSLLHVLSINPLLLLRLVYRDLQ